MKRLATILTLASSLLAATPALAGGWYLVLPPAGKDNTVDAGAPLKEWHVAAAFDTARECQGAYEVFQAKAKQEVAAWDAKAQTIARSNKDDNTKRAELGDVFDHRYWADQVVPRATCIASDDPRLAR
jgi:hypothetical protein